MNNAATFIRIPTFAADLLYAAKTVLAAPNSDLALEGLELAVTAFEQAMPVRDGVIQEA